MEDVFLLSRIQFAANISFHILFPTISIALGWVLLFFKIRYSMTRDEFWLKAYLFYVKIFALTFALGVVSGITMSFQFGTNWPGFMEKVGNIAGPLLAYEVLTAFFMEATFLGIMLFGFGKVSNRVHTIATALVAIGTTLSSFWILALNSWMHTPAGYQLIDDVVHVSSWMEVIFNPSFFYRLIHMLLACGLTAAFLMAGLSAYRQLLGDSTRQVSVALKTGVFMAAILIPFQIVAGDMHGLNTLEHQPQKVAAMEGVWETEQGAPLLLFAVPDEQTRSNRFTIGIPKMASFILTHDVDGTVQGLNDFIGEHPPVKPVFYGFRIMVGIGLLMLLVAWFMSYHLIRHKQLTNPMRRVLVAMTFSGWVATLAGWYVTEIGRQPWLVSGLLLSKDAVTDVPADNVLFTLVVYLSLYAFLLTAYVTTLFLLARKGMQKATKDKYEALIKKVRI